MIHFSGTVNDAEELSNQISLSWFSNIDGEFSTQGSSASGVLDVYVSDLSSGQHSISVTATDSMGLADSTSLSLFINEPPTVPTLSLTPDPAYTEDELSAQASGSTDTEGHNITYAYLWLQNNNATSYTGSVLPSSATSKGENWTIRVTPNDGYHDGSYAEATVQIQNSAPVVSTVFTDTTEATSSETVTCTGSASDVDGDTLSESYLWENQTTGTVLGASSSITFSPLSVSPGDSILCSYSVDDGTDTASSSAIVSIINSEPSIDSLSVVPSTPYLGDTLTCLGTVSDSDLESTTESYLWENQTTGSVLSTSMSLELDTSNASPNDVISCTLTVSDSSGGSSEDVATATVGNLAPSIDSLSFDQSNVAIGDTLTCLSSESDPEGEIPTVTYEWTNETTGTSIGNGASITLTSSMATGLEELSCTATATDSFGESDTENISIFVDETMPEFDTEASITPNTGITTSSTLSCAGVASDPDGTTVSLGYAWSVGTTTLGTSQSITLSPSIVQPTDVVQCLITATDGAGEQATSSATVMVGNTAPTLGSVSITPSTGVDTSTVLICAASVSDADLETLTPTYTWMNGSTTLGTGTTLTLTSSLAQPSDSISCVASVTDGYGASAELSNSVSVDNTAPVVDSVSISPATTYNDSTVSCSAVVSDADNQSLTTTYEWQNSTTGVNLGTGSSVTLDSSLASRNDVLICTATVTDSSGDTATSSVSQTLDNRAPSMSGVYLNPALAYVDSTLSCSESGSDLDGDSVTYSYAWSVNGGATVGTSTTLSGAFVAGDTVVCSVTPNDGLVDGSGSTASIVISNSIPSVSAVSLSPDPVYTDDLLTATPTYSDLDGDTMSLTYTWSVDGNEVQTGATHTLAGSFFAKGEEVQVSVVADDGTDVSGAETVSITVSNTMPTSPSIDLVPSAPIEQVDDLVCSISTSSVDVDSDTVTYGFTWTVDGSPFTSATDTASSSTVSAFDTSGSEEWICMVTPNDGEADGVFASASVNIDSGSYESCLDAYNSGNTTSGMYPLDNANITETDVYCDMSYSGGGWTECFELVNTTSEDLSNNTWFDNCVDYSLGSWSGAEVMVQLENDSASTVYQSHGSRTNTWTYNQITSTASVDSQYYSSSHNYLVSLSNSDKLFLSGKTGSNAGCGGSFGNGYAVVVYPSSPNYHSNPKMIVASYNQYVAPHNNQGRSFTDWSTSHEISFDAGNSFSTCTSTPPHTGTFRFFVR
jgi:hypothetical protein